MEENKSDGACAPSFSSAELERLWEEACQRAASRFGMRRAVLREDIEEVRQEFATLVAAAEREACADQISKMRKDMPVGYLDKRDALYWAEKAIRERSNDKAQGADGGLIAGGSPGAAGSAARSDKC